MPILYVANREKLVRRRVTAVLLPHLQTRRCSRCETKVMHDRKAFEKIRQLAVRAGRPLLVHCDRCARQVKPPFLVALAPMGPAIAAAVDEHLAATAHS